MKRPAKNFSTIPVYMVIGVLLLSLASPALANTKPTFLYVANSGDSFPGVLVPNTQVSNTISGYAINSTTGALTPLPGSPFTAGSNPYALTLDPASQFLYVANRVSNTISAFTVNASTGALTQIPGSPFAAGSAPDAVAVSPSGQFLYEANQVDNTIWVYSIDAETGALTPIGSPFAAGITPTSLTMDPQGRFLYVSENDQNDDYFNFLGYTINSGTGALTPISSGIMEANYEGPRGAAIDPAGKYLFQINYFGYDWGVDSYSINGSTGGTIFTGFGDGSNVPSAVAVHPSGQFVYVTDDRSDYVAAYTLDNTTGYLTRIPGSPYGDNCEYGPCAPAGPYVTGELPESIAIDPSGQFAYVGNMYTNNVSGFSINASTGVMTPIPGSPFAAGTGPASVAIASSFYVPINFSSFQLNVTPGSMTTFTVSGLFTLGSGNSGINPLSQPVTIQVGSYTVTIPVGSFTQRIKNEYNFAGQINGVTLQVAILSTSSNSYSIAVEGKGNMVIGSTNPVPVGLSIGVNQGSMSTTAVF